MKIFATKKSSWTEKLKDLKDLIGDFRIDDKNDLKKSENFSLQNEKYREN